MTRAANALRLCDLLALLSAVEGEQVRVVRDAYAADLRALAAAGLVDRHEGAGESVVFYMMNDRGRALLGAIGGKVGGT